MARDVPADRAGRADQSTVTCSYIAPPLAGLCPQVRRQFRDDAAERVDDHAPDDLAALGIQVCAIDLALIVAGAQICPHVIPGVLGVREADCVQVDERHLLFRRERADDFHVRRLRRPDRAVFVVETPHQRGHEDRLCADRPDVIDVARHVGSVCGLRIGFAFRALPRFVVVSELNQVVLAALGQRFGPPSFVDETLRAAAVGSRVDDVTSPVTSRLKPEPQPESSVTVESPTRTMRIGGEA